jgi:hypothetical protein
MKIKFLDIAQLELDESFEYYEIQHSKLGYRFVNEVKNAIDRISYFPFAWQQITINTRRCLVKTFPYGIIYQILDDTILIIAIANLHQKPNYWKDRIQRTPS